MPGRSIGCRRRDSSATRSGVGDSPDGTSHTFHDGFQSICGLPAAIAVTRNANGCRQLRFLSPNCLFCDIQSSDQAFNRGKQLLRPLHRYKRRIAYFFGLHCSFQCNRFKQPPPFTRTVQVGQMVARDSGPGLGFRYAFAYSPIGCFGERP